MTDQQQLDVALSLARHGFYVFPLRTDGTKSPVKGMLWDAMATTDAEQVVTWWSLDHPGALVGVHAGRSGLHIIDVDEKGCDNSHHPEDCSGSGSTELERAGITIPKTFGYVTPSGGHHYWTKAPADADLTIAQDFPARHVDIRAGVGFVAYYGPALDTAPKLAPAPENTLRHRSASSGALSDASATMATWLGRADHGKASKPVKVARSAVTRDGMSRNDMLHAVTELVKLGTEPGAGAAYVEARTTYLADYPDHARSWDAAAEGSVKKFGLPPVTIPLTKPERKAIKQRSKEPALPPARSATASSLGIIEDGPLAERIAATLVDKWAWTEVTGLLRYRDNVWSTAPEQSLLDAVRRELIPIEVDEHARAAQQGDRKGVDKALGLLSRNRARAVTDLVKGILMEDQRVADDYPDLLNCPNGVVDLKTGELLPSSPAYLFTKITSVDYDPNAHSADWDKALEALTPGTREWMRLRFGQAITGHIPDDAVVPFLIGGGENGKSAVFNGVREAAGTYAVTVPDKLLLANVGDHPTEMMTLQGTRLAIVEELPEGRQLNTKRLKDIAGTPKINARRMRQDFVEFKATHSLFVSANQTPIVVEVDHGTWRRLCVVPFRIRFVRPGKKLKGKWQRHADVGLRDRLGDDPHPAVLAWAVRGAMAWYANDKTLEDMPREVEKATRKWRHDADPVMQFVDEELELHEGSAIWVMDMLSQFNSWQESQGLQKWNSRTISARFAGHESLPEVAKTFVKFGTVTKASRPLFVTKKLGERAEAWKGVRFKNQNEPWIPASQEVQDFTSRLGE